MAAFEAFRQCGGAETYAALHDLQVQYGNAKKALEDDDALDADGDGVADVEQRAIDRTRAQLLADRTRTKLLGISKSAELTLHRLQAALYGARNSHEDDDETAKNQRFFAEVEQRAVDHTRAHLLHRPSKSIDLDLWTDEKCPTAGDVEMPFLNCFMPS